MSFNQEDKLCISVGVIGKLLRNNSYETLRKEWCILAVFAGPSGGDSLVERHIPFKLLLCRRRRLISGSDMADRACLCSFKRDGMPCSDVMDVSKVKYGI